MNDRLGWRLKLGVLVPAFNTTVQPELEAMRPAGVTNHVARIEIPDFPLASDDDQEKVIRSLGDDLFGALPFPASWEHRRASRRCAAFPARHGSAC